MKVRRERLAFTAALSLAAHVAIAGVVVWGSAGLVEHRGTARKAGPAITWVALPQINSRQAEPVAHDPLKVDVPPVVATAARASLPAPLAGPLRGSSPRSVSGPAGREEVASGGPGTRMKCGGVTEVRASYDADPSPDSGGSARDVFGPTAPLVTTTTAAVPPDDNRAHDVQFRIRADGLVTSIAVSPPIRDSDYLRRFIAAVSTFVFGPVQTPDGRPIDYVYSCVVYPT